MPAPTATELAGNQVVLEALELAWSDSTSLDPINRHEEGGWIYLEVTTGRLIVRRAPAGKQASVNLSTPPPTAGAVIVGKFHTHPNPTADGWEPGPSPADLRIDALHGVPDLIRADDGTHFSGPDSRRGGLAGGPGYPP